LGETRFFPYSNGRTVASVTLYNVEGHIVFSQKPGF